METKFTPGPWYSDKNGSIWRRHPSELYQNGGGVAGDRPIATAFQGWNGEGVSGYPSEANARLIAAAPDMFDALDHAPTLNLDETAEQFRSRYITWFEKYRAPSLFKAQGKS